MLTFHATAKRYRDGFRPMVCVRNAKGQMIGSRVGHVTPWSENIARSEALLAALRVSLRMPHFVRVA